MNVRNDAAPPNPHPQSPILNPQFVDLHLHTNQSDGADSPAQVVDQAKALGFAAIAITDHDTVAGVPEAEAAARKCGIEFLSGVEITASFASAEVHVVGLGIDVVHRPLLDALDSLATDRALRADKIVERLSKLGVLLDRIEIERFAVHGTIGRMHIAEALRRRGITSTVQQGFDKYLKKGRKAYVPPPRLSCREAIDVIHAARGLAIVAHPGIGRTTTRLLPRLLALPFDGLEVYHTGHSPGQVAQFAQLAREQGLLVSGGSDSHGVAKGEGSDLGKVRVPYACFERIREALLRVRS